MLFFRGAIAAAENRNHDGRSGLSPVELEYLKHVVFGGFDQLPEVYVAAADRLPSKVHPTINVSPVVNHGRWIVPCPWCFNASVASRQDRRFFCVECRNVGAAGQWVQVVWPELSEEIEAVLVMRPDPRTRIWLVTEKLDDLLRENELHGVM